MANVMDYIKWRGDVTFDLLPLNEIDSLIFSELCYAPYEEIPNEEMSHEGITISALSEKFFKKNTKKSIGAIIPTDKILNLLKMIANSERFKDVIVRGYVNDVDDKAGKQFCAMCFDMCDNTTYVAFSGTDDTLVGWKESLNMSVFTPIPSQEESVKYVRDVANLPRRRLYLGGHSKGGNLAAYAALMSEEKIQKKIISVHSFDGPGFQKSFTKAFEKKEIHNKIIKILPQCAFVGAIFEPAGSIKYVKCTSKGAYQHDAFFWEVEGKEFVKAAGPDKASVNFHDFLEEWFSYVDDSEKAEFIDAVFKLLSLNDAATLTDIASDKFKFIVSILRTDDESKKVFLKAIKKFIKEKYFGSSKNKGVKALPKNNKKTNKKGSK